MASSSVSKLNFDSSTNNKHIILSSFLLLAIILLATVAFDLSLKLNLGLAALAIALFFSYNAKHIYSFQVLILFTPIALQFLHSSIFFPPVILFSCIFAGKRIDADILKSPLNKYLIIYLIAMIISLANTVSLIGSLTRMINYFSFILLIILTQVIYSDSKKGIYQIYLFLTMTLINTIYMIAMYTGKRNFGFMNINFVDYVAMGLLLMLVLYFYSRKFKIILLIPALLLGYGMLITQTRNVWLSFAIAFLITVIIFLTKNKKIYIERSHIIIFCASFAILFAIIFISSKDLTESTSQRVESITESNEENIKQGIVTNSLLTRVLIWHTCYNAFIQHPIIGIGAYSFPFSSQYYYTFPKIFYKKYVEELNPHETFIATLTETGIAGFIAFMMLLYGIVKVLIMIFKLSNTFEDVRYSMILLSGNIYIFCSMLFTDAWLWGQQMMLWGMFLGLLLSHLNYLNKKNDAADE